MPFNESTRLALFPPAEREQLKIFVVSEGLADSSALKAVVAATGGVLAETPEDARFILCNKNDVPSSLLAWRGQPSKAVLDSSWLPRCATSGRLLLENDDYGGCLIQLPLPTPSKQRPTPEKSLDGQDVKYEEPPSFNVSQPTAGSLVTQILSFVSQKEVDPTVNTQLMAILKDQLVHETNSGSAMTTSPAPPQSPSPSTLGPQNLFTKPDGQRLRFIIDPSLGPPRKSLVQKIKSNGGQIVDAQPDFVIYNTQSVDYSQVYYSTTGCVIQRAFVDDCVRADTLLDHKRYLEAEPEKKPGRRIGARPSSFMVRRTSSPPRPHRPDHSEDGKKATAGKRRRPMLSPNREGPPGPSAATTSLKRNSSTHDSRQSESQGNGEEHSKRRRKTFTDPETRDLSPPSPPKGEHQSMDASGKFKYTEAEFRWAQQYIEFILTRDPDTSIQRLAQMLSEKTPHHPWRSWNGAIKRIPGFDLAAAKRRAGIAFRKAQATKAASTKASDQAPVNQSPPSGVASSSAPTPQEAHKIPLEDQIRSCAHFFAFPETDDEEGSSSDYWSQLEKKHGVPQGYTSWRDFYDAHHQTIQAEYNRLLGS